VQATHWPLLALQYFPAALEAQSVFTAQGFATQAFDWQTWFAAQSAFIRQAKHDPLETSHLGWPAVLQSVSALQAPATAMQAWDWQVMPAPQSAFWTQGKHWPLVPSQNLPAMLEAQSAFWVQGLARHICDWQALPAPQSASARHAKQLPLPASHLERPLIVQSVSTLQPAGGVTQECDWQALPAPQSALATQGKHWPLPESQNLPAELLAQSAFRAHGFAWHACDWQAWFAPQSASMRQAKQLPLPVSHFGRPDTRQFESDVQPAPEGWQAKSEPHWEFRPHCAFVVHCTHRIEVASQYCVGAEQSPSVWQAPVPGWQVWSAVHCAPAAQSLLKRHPTQAPDRQCGAELEQSVSVAQVGAPPSGADGSTQAPLTQVWLPEHSSVAMQTWAQQPPAQVPDAQSAFAAQVLPVPQLAPDGSHLLEMQERPWTQSPFTAQVWPLVAGDLPQPVPTSSIRGRKRAKNEAGVGRREQGCPGLTEGSFTINRVPPCRLAEEVGCSGRLFAWDTVEEISCRSQASLTRCVVASLLRVGGLVLIEFTGVSLILPPMLPPSASARARQLGLLLLVATVACNGSKADRAARARIFSAEEPASDVKKANETLAVADAPSDGAVWLRLWRMDQLEVTRRLGGHKSTSKVTFQWKRGEKTVELTEQSEFATDAQGQFHAKLTNDQDAGLEFVWAGSKAYSKGRYGVFQSRRSDRAQQDHWRDEATNALRTAFELFGQRLHGTAAGTVALPDGHTGRRFNLSLGEAWGPKDPMVASPKPIYGKVRASGHDEVAEDAPDGGVKEAPDAGVKEAPDAGKDSRYRPGPDEDTARRLEFDDRRVPESASGEIIVDEASAVIVKGFLRGRFRVPEATPQSGAVLELNVTYDVTPDASLKIEPPKEVSVPRLPHAVNDPLWFMKDGGSGHSSPAGADDEPEINDEETPAPPTPHPAPGH
jgi:hypothetical protein